MHTVRIVIAVRNVHAVRIVIAVRNVYTVRIVIAVRNVYTVRIVRAVRNLYTVKIVMAARLLVLLQVVAGNYGRHDRLQTNIPREDKPHEQAQAADHTWLKQLPGSPLTQQSEKGPFMSALEI